jgi:hypothetical protein
VSVKGAVHNVGFIPDSWEVALEPDTFGWGCREMGNVTVAAGDLLKANGYPYKVFVAASSSNIRHSGGCVDYMVTQVPASMSYLAEFSYHIYGGVGPGEREGIRNYAQTLGIRTSMLERMNAAYDSLQLDLKLANVSAWQQYTLAYGTVDNGGHYFTDTGTNKVALSSYAKFLRQYFKYARKGAVRIDAQSNNPIFDPVVFRNSNGDEVVVIDASNGGSFQISGLAAGTYGAFYTTGVCATSSACTVNAYDVQLPIQSISSGQPLTESIPSVGVITVYAISGSTPTPTPVPTPSLSPQSTATPQPTATPTPTLQPALH